MAVLNEKWPVFILILMRMYDLFLQSLLASCYKMLVMKSLPSLMLRNTCDEKCFIILNFPMTKMLAKHGVIPLDSFSFKKYNTQGLGQMRL